MSLIWESLREAISLISTGDAQVLGAASRSLGISLSAVSMAALAGVPVGMLLAQRQFAGKRFLVLLFRAGMSLPTVFIGVLCYALFSRRGPFASFDVLYSAKAIVFGELILAFPIVVSLTYGAIKALPSEVSETAKTLGAGPLRRAKTYLSECRVGVVLAVLTAFGRCVTELGIAMMVGGNIQDQTRTLATATAVETGKGEFARGMAMGLILLLLSFTVTSVVVWLGKEDAS